MKPFPKTIKTKDRLFKLIAEGDRSVVFEVRFSSSYKCYEVWQKQLKPARIIKKVELPSIWRKPSDIHFGKWAWSYYILDKAIEKFKQLEKEKAVVRRTPVVT